MRRLISYEKLNWVEVKNKFEEIYPNLIFKSINSIDFNNNTIEVNYTTTPDLGVVVLPKDVSKELIDKFDTSDWL